MDASGADDEAAAKHNIPLESVVPVEGDATAAGRPNGDGVAESPSPTREGGLRRRVVDSLKDSYAEARTMQFDHTLVESLDLEEPDLYYRYAVAKRGGRSPVPSPASDTVPPTAPHTAAGGRGNGNGSIPLPTSPKEDEPEVPYPLMRNGSFAAKGTHNTLSSTVTVRPERSTRDRLAEGLLRFLDDFARYFLILFLATLVACMYKFIFFSSEEGLEWRIHLMEGYLGIGHGGGGEKHRRAPGSESTPDSGQLHDPNYAAAYFVSVGTSLLFALPPALLIVLFKPAAAGAGMPEVIALLNGDLQTRAFEFAALVLKICGSIGIVASGLFSGFDGPMIQIGAVMAYLMISVLWGPTEVARHVGLRNMGLGTAVSEMPKVKTSSGSNMVTLHNTFRRRAIAHEVDEVRHSEKQKRTLDFATLGACAAIGSAFRSPLAAVTFALEEAITHYDPSFISRAMLVGIWAFLMLSFLNKIDWFNPYSFSIFSINGHCTIRTEYLDLLLWTAMGFVAGVAGHLYNLAITKIRTLRTRLTWPAKPGRAIVDLVVVVLISMAVVVFLPLAFDTCTPLRQSLDHVSDLRNACDIICNTTAEPPVTYLNFECHLFLDESIAGDKICLPDDVQTNVFATIVMMLDNVSTNACATLPKNATYRFDPFSATSRQELAAGTRLPYIKKGTVVDPATGQTVECVWQMRSLLWDIPERVLQNLYLRGLYYLFDWQVLLTFSFVYLALSMMVNGICLPTDMVIPNLVIGASFGRLCALGVNVLKANSGATLVDPGLYAVLGMAAFWSGTSRMSITIALIAIETTFELTYLPAILVVVTVATIVGNSLGPSLYHMEIHNRQIPYLDIEPPQQSKDVLARKPVSEMMSRPVHVVVGLRPTQGEIRRVLEEPNSFAGYPVVDQEGGLIGLVLRQRLEALLASAVVSDDEATMDLSFVMNPTPTCVPATMSVLKAFATFRSLKLRHMVVVDSFASGRVVGLVTRRNLVDAEHTAAHVGHEASHQ
ncbi:voltage gated chloride channel-domain-containing protein [Hyaloraphidium curvatum]|nr:voltage gated chloride channel-domain-containing protein [Hyaloraphidium curvatum]